MQMTIENNAVNKYFLLFAVALAFIVVCPDSALAVISPMGNVLCKIVQIAYGNFGRALATLAVISLGVGAMLGKVSWGLALTVATGISVVFSADAIVTALIGAPVIGCVAR
jgi:type IV secretion system protein VirB2